MRVTLFTDTLGDVNGVSRFVQNMAQCAVASGRELHVITSTSCATPTWSNIFNFAPVCAMKAPRYEQLELALPPLRTMWRHLDQFPPDVIHISTPGPVGFVGACAARLRGVPALSVYHTDFPAYIDRLFDDGGLTWLARWYMQRFYRRVSRVFARSSDYRAKLHALGIPRERIAHLAPGLDLEAFGRRRRDPGIWNRLAASDAALEPLCGAGVKVLYVGRISVEKNVPMLARIWKSVERACARAKVATDLIVVGDGPWRARMQEELRGSRAFFPGFRHGEELSGIYATSDCFVFPSTTDTLGQVVMEAQASGLPALVTDLGGPKEIVQHDVTGFVLAADDDAAWIRAIVDLALDAGKRAQMGEAAAQSMQRFCIARSFEQFWEAHAQEWHARLQERDEAPRTRRARKNARSSAPASPLISPGAGVSR